MPPPPPRGRAAARPLCCYHAREGVSSPLFIRIPYRRIVIRKVLHASLCHLSSREIVGVFGQLCSMHNGMTPPTKGDEIVRVCVCATLGTRDAVVYLQPTDTITNGAAEIVTAVNGLANGIGDIGRDHVRAPFQSMPQSQHSKARAARAQAGGIPPRRRTGNADSDRARARAADTDRGGAQRRRARLHGSTLALCYPQRHLKGAT